MKDKMNAKVDTDKQEQEIKGLQNTQSKRIREIEMIGKRRDALHHEDPMYEMKYDALVAEEEKKYNEIHVLKEEIKNLAQSSFYTGERNQTKRKKRFSKSTLTELKYLKTLIRRGVL